jgi:hypothetical protein
LARLVGLVRLVELPGLAAGALRDAVGPTALVEPTVPLGLIVLAVRDAVGTGGGTSAAAMNDGSDSVDAPGLGWP